MKQLNTICSFVLLSFCLLINVSTAEIVADVIYSSATTSGYTTTSELFGYTGLDIHKLMYRYIKNSESYANDFNTLITSASSNGYNYFIFNSDSITSKYYAFIPKGMDVAFYQYDSAGTRFNLCVESSSELPVYFGTFNITNSVPSSNGLKQYPFSDLEHGLYINSNYYITNTTSTPFLTNTNVKLLNTSLIWDGTTYLYQAPSTEEPETPTMPTNAEIASAVQMFYNSVYQLPNTAFKDFVVLYDNTTGLYTYIGHTRGNALGQVIVEPNGYYEGYKFDVQWWKFFLDEQNDSWNWQNLDSYFNYYVYTSDGTIENLNYVGKSNISGLIEKSGPWATANTVIVYSTNDYPVKYVTFSDDSPDPVIQTGTIQGDQYTYDENLDITDNQYNPLDNFISINYPSTLVGNADFDSFLNTFNENKDVLVLPQNANWVILANTSLFSYFGSFIIMCTLFIIIERIMRG